MSRDIFVQDIPPGISDVDEIPNGWQPRPLPFEYAEVVGALRELASEIDMTGPEWLHVAMPGVDVEVHVTADPVAADAFIGRLLERLGARAFDPASEGGIFQP